jgi:hypothetical protein
MITGCSLAPAINHDVSDYFLVNDLAANRIILLNILRAKDGAPLHFSELSQVRGQLSIGATAATTFPFGPYSHATTIPRELATIGGTVSSSPSFDIASLDTKDFTDGVMSPISPRTLEFFLDEGIDYRMVLMLLISGIRTAGSDEMLLNAPNSSRVVCYAHPLGQNALPVDYRIIEADEPCNGPSEPEYYAFLRVVNKVGRLYPILVRQPPRPVGPPFNLDLGSNLRAISNLDPRRYDLLRLPSGQYQLATTSQGDSLVLCEETAQGPRVASIVENSDDRWARVSPNACEIGQDTTAEEDMPDEVLNIGRHIAIGTAPGTFVVKLRSTLEVIQYVGQVLAFQQQETAKYPRRPERCVTLEYEPLDGPTCERGVLFHLQNSTTSLYSSGISLAYDGQRWSLPAPRVCTDPDGCDHTLQTMSMISLLLNQNKSAKDIASTPAVQVVP